eukprot:403375769
MGSILSSCCNKEFLPLKQKEFEVETSMVRTESVRRILSFKDFKGFKKIRNISDYYNFYQQLGQGSFGEVVKAEHRKANVICAIKIIKKKKIQEHQILIDLMHNELKVLEETTHPHIMRIFELLEDEHQYYIVSELLNGGELYDRIVKMKQFNEQNAAYLIYQVLLALCYMHNKNMIHRDIKPENILLEKSDPNSLNIKITDFGFACFYEPGEGLKEVLGSPLYMAPEIVREETYDEKVDTWSVGVIAYILLSGRPPFKGKSKQEMFKSITSSDLVFDHKIWDNISDEAKDFISKALIKDSKLRYDAKQLLSHQWIFKQVQTPDIKQQVQLDVAQNLKDFKNTTVFQGGILSFIVGLKASSEELEELKNLFLRLDTSRDGTLSIDEIQAGMQQMMGILGSQKVNEYQDLMRTLDKDGNGVIDYTERTKGSF